MATLLPFPQELRQPLPVVIGNADYTEFEQLLIRISGLITLSGLDRKVMQHAVDQAERKALENYHGKEDFPGLDYHHQIRIQQKAEVALRVIIIMELKGLGYRRLSCALAESPLLQWFCKIDKIDKIQVPSKSTLHRYEKMFTEEFIEDLIHELIEAASTPSKADDQKQLLLLEEEINLINCYLDTTCIKANIHYPVDWILLRDATRTLMKAVKLIRVQGLVNRMADPSEFIKEMNKLCIKMTHARNQKDSKKKRKNIFRLMKKLMKKIKQHAEKHKILLKNYWEETDLSERQAYNIIERIDSILAQLPEAVNQATERIIGERKVKSEDKILSLYEEDINVLVRNKTGMKVEFGNKLLICEQEEGIIIDWKLYKDGAPYDTTLLAESVERIFERHGRIGSITTDRGFFSKPNQDYLSKKSIIDYMCPRAVTELKERLQDEEFVNHQTRRGQTEARIAIFKNKFLGRPLRSKRFTNRSRSVAWAVLAHNLWVIARLPWAEEAQLKEAA